MANTSIKIYTAEMSEEMQREALQCALLAVNMHKEGSNIAQYIKMEFDRKYRSTWQCIVGSTGYFVSHGDNCYIDFSVDNKNILLFKTE